MPDDVFVNGRAVVHKTSAGQSIAFPDVCLCPPGPPAGPIPTPLPNTVVAADLDGAATTVLVAGNPTGTRKSFFRKSTGNEVSMPTGGGILTTGVQGKAHFRLGHSWNTFYEGEPAVRHLDPLTHNHTAFPGNTPPAPWLSTMDPALPGKAPSSVAKELSEGDAWIEIKLVDEARQPVVRTRYELKTPRGTTITGRGLAGGIVKIRGLAQGRCELRLPDVDDACARAKRSDAPPTKVGQRPYQPRSRLTLETGKAHEVVAPGMVSLWVDLPIRPGAASARDDRFILRSKDGKYEIVRTVKDDRVRGDDGLTLEFPGLRPGNEYTLVHDTGAEGVVYRIFEERSFEELFPEEAPARKDAEPDHEVAAAKPEFAHYQPEEEEDDGEIPEPFDE